MVSERRYRLYIDESGNHFMGKNSERYLGLLGVAIPLDTYVSALKPAMLKIKQDHFTDDPDSPVVLHREEVAQRTGRFSVLNDNAIRDRFNRAMTDFYATQEYTLIAVVIDKDSHREVYGDGAKHPYHYCAEAMLERFYFFLDENNGVGDVFAESRGADEDDLLQSEWRRFRQRGTGYVKRDELSRRILGNEIEFRNKNQNVYGLQLADMLAKVATRDVLIDYSHFQKFRSSFERRVASIIQAKYRFRKNTSKGCGKKLLFAQKKPAPFERRQLSMSAPVSEGPGDHG